MDWKKITYFKASEFACKHCGACEMDENFMVMLDVARGDANVPFNITSGYRCPDHDNAVGGKGNHSTGKAADIEAISSRVRFRIISAAIEAGFTRIGVGKTFIHLDSCTEADNKPTEVIWQYD